MNQAGQLPAIEHLIPHQPPMRLLDKIVSADDERLTASATLIPNCPFWTPQGVPACIGLEYLGQAAAAFFSVYSQRAEEQKDPSATEPRPGMFIASRSYESTIGFFPTERTLLIEVAPQSQVSAAGLVKFTGTLSDAESSQLFAKGDISVYLPPA